MKRTAKIAWLLSAGLIGLGAAVQVGTFGSHALSIGEDAGLVSSEYWAWGAPAMAVSGRREVAKTAAVDVPATSLATAVTTSFTFAPAQRYRRLNDGGGYQDYVAVAVGDITGDGRDDVIALPADNEIHVFVQGTDGRLPEPRIWSYGTANYLHSKQLVLADFNEDGVLDVATPSVQGQFHTQGGLNLLLSDQHGGFAFSQVLGEIERAVGSWTVLDMDSDGHVDIVGFENVTDYSGGAECGPSRMTCPRYRMMHGDGKGGFGRVTTVQLHEPYEVMGAGSHDLNDDGFADLVYALLGDPFKPGKVIVRYHDGRGGLGSPVTLHHAPDAGGGLVFGDFNDDARLDSLLVPAQQDFSPEVHLQAAGGGFLSPYAVWGYPLRANWPLPADFDGDGRTDIASIQLKPIPNTPWSEVKVALNLQRDGDLGMPQLSETVPELDKISLHPAALSAGDVNGDGCRDLVAAASYEGLYFLMGRDCIPPMLRMPPLPDESGFKDTWEGPGGT